MKEYQVIGRPMELVSSREKVTGRAKFTDDIRVASPLTVKILRSPIAAGRIQRIRTERALEISGVKAVITGQDLPRTFGVLPISRDEPALAQQRVRYVGEPVAAVAAETLDVALRALKLIEVEYVPTEPCLDASAALLPTSDPIHPELKKKNNVHKSVTQEFGDVAEGFNKAQAVVEAKFEFSPVNHGFTEPHATQVEISSQGVLTVYSATQVPHYLHLAMAEVLSIPHHRIRVIKPHLGGGFGGKSDPFPHEMIAAKLALVTGRNTRIVLTREEVFITNHGRHPTTLSMKLGMNGCGEITALSANVLIDGGAYASFGVVTSYYNGVLLQGPYKLPAFSFHCDRVYTNRPMCGAMRGHGGVNPRFGSEVLVDMACERLGLDPAQARLAMIHGENTLTANRFRITSCGLKKGLKQAMQRSGWKNKFKKLPYGQGIGVACGFFISGSALAIHWDKIPQSQVRLTLDFDGAITVYSGAADIGQGSDTMLAQIVGEVLGVAASYLTVVSGDTRLCPVDFGSYSSRVTFMAGNAARNAAISMRRELTRAACDLWGIEPPENHHPDSAGDFFRQGGRRPDFTSAYLGPNPNYDDGFDFSAGKITALLGPARGKTLGYGEVVKRAIEHRGSLQTSGIYIAPKMGGDFKGAGAGLSPAYSYTAFITEVRVDPQTGFIRVEKVTCAHDCGRALNPLAVEGQIQGSIHMGLGQALMESMQYRNGVIQNASFLDYKIPSALEMPEIEMIYDLCDDSEGPFGAKEAGEGVLAPFIPSIANAVYDAVGVRLTSVPMTPDRVLNELRRQSDKGGR